MDVFESDYEKYDSWYDRNKFVFESELKALRKFELKGRGLEIGVGTGRFSQALGIGEGIDTSKNMLKLAQDRGVKVKKAYAESLPYENNTFDYAASITSLSFLKNPFLVFKEVHRVLKSPGLLLVGIIRKDSPWGDYHMKKETGFFQEARFFYPEQVIDLFEKTGFTYKAAYQTLFKGPKDSDTNVEIAVEGYDKGSFVVLGGEK